jgi:L-alanine-DL-glutamate epimerase-like enolase superfamily enzyme
MAPIARVDAQRLAIPAAAGCARGGAEGALLVQITAADGRVGVGERMAAPAGQEAVPEPAIAQLLEPAPRRAAARRRSTRGEGCAAAASRAHIRGRPRRRCQRGAAGSDPGGGVTEVQRIADLCEPEEVQLLPPQLGHGHCHLGGNALAGRCTGDSPARVSRPPPAAERLVATGELRHGRVPPPGTPGPGLMLEPDFIAAIWRP